MLLVIAVGVLAALGVIAWTLTIARSASCPHCNAEGVPMQPLIPFLAAFLWYCPTCGQTSRLGEVRSGEVRGYSRPGGLRGRALTLLLGPDPSQPERPEKKRRSLARRAAPPPRPLDDEEWLDDERPRRRRRP